MTSFGDRLYLAQRGATDLLFQLGKSSQLAYYSFDAVVAQLKQLDGNPEIPVQVPVGMRADKQAIMSEFKHTQRVARSKYYKPRVSPVANIRRVSVGNDCGTSFL